MLGMSEMWVILILALLFFGGSQIPKLARSLGRARKEFEEGSKEAIEETKKSNEIQKSSGNDS